MVPFAALRRSAQHKYLIERFTISLAPSIRALAVAKEQYEANLQTIEGRPEVKLLYSSMCSESNASHMLSLLTPIYQGQILTC